MALLLVLFVFVGCTQDAPKEEPQAQAPVAAEHVATEPEAAPAEVEEVVDAAEDAAAVAEEAVEGVVAEEAAPPEEEKPAETE